MGGAYTSETFSTSAVGADTIDASRCAQLAFQVSSSADAAGSIDVKHSFVTGEESTLIEDMGVADGTTILCPITQGPFGRVWFDCTRAAGSWTITMVGYPMQGVN